MKVENWFFLILVSIASSNFKRVVVGLLPAMPLFPLSCLSSAVVSANLHLFWCHGFSCHEANVSMP